MVIFPHAKLNLGLDVLHIRPDGYREIRSLLYPIPLHDVLEALPDPHLAPGEVQFTHSGLPVPGDTASNLCLQAVERMRRVHALPPLRIHLHKAIPIGAGLGGGSSDGAHMLLLLRDLLKLQLEQGQLHSAAGDMGSDCPFFLENGPRFASGRGELLSMLQVSLSGYWLVLAYPGIHISTAEVYARTPCATPTTPLIERLQRPVQEWRQNVTNRMEEYVFRQYPAVHVLKNELYAAGAAYASMSGSGSSVFGIFIQEPELIAGSTLTRQVVLSVRLP
jgi:4-diphosphocytidyl-2-C-methyl-D-erythritol kinase